MQQDRLSRAFCAHSRARWRFDRYVPSPCCICRHRSGRPEHSALWAPGRLKNPSDARSRSIRIFRHHDVVEAGTADLTDPDFSRSRGPDSLLHALRLYLRQTSERVRSLLAEHFSQADTEVQSICVREDWSAGSLVSPCHVDDYRQSLSSDGPIPLDLFIGFLKEWPNPDTLFKIPCNLVFLQDDPSAGVAHAHRLAAYRHPSAPCRNTVLVLCSNDRTGYQVMMASDETRANVAEALDLAFRPPCDTQGSRPQILTSHVPCTLKDVAHSDRQASSSPLQPESTATRNQTAGAPDASAKAPVAPRGRATRQLGIPSHLSSVDAPSQATQAPEPAGLVNTTGCPEPEQARPA